MKILTDEEILRIINLKGCFVVSWRYRDGLLMKRCRKLYAKGLIKYIKGKGKTYFYPIRVNNGYTGQ